MAGHTSYINTTAQFLLGERAANATLPEQRSRVLFMFSSFPVTKDHFCGLTERSAETVGEMAASENMGVKIYLIS